MTRALAFLRRHGLLLSLLALAAAGVWLRLRVGPIPYDDAYISWRYVARWVSGHGLTYNEGERVMGFSCPLWVLMLAPFALLHVPIPAASFGLAVAADAATVLLLGWLSTRLVPTDARCTVAGAAAGLLAAALYALAPKAVLPAVSGMETCVYVALIVGACAALVATREREAVWGTAGRRSADWWAKNPNGPSANTARETGRLWRTEDAARTATYRAEALAAALTGLVALMRPDGLLLVPVVLWALRRDRRRLLLHVALALGPLALWSAAAWWYYGSPIPQSVTAKAAGAAHLPLGSDLAQLLTYAATPLRPFSSLAKQEPSFWSLLISIPIMLVGLVRLLRAPTSRRVFLWPLLYVATFSLANRYLFSWYFAPVFWSVALLVGVGLASLTAWVRLPALPVACILVTAAAPLLWTVTEFDARPMRHHHANREMVYAQAGHWLSVRHLGPAAVPEIGAFGWAYPGRVLDLCGLVSPECMPYIGRGWNAAEKKVLILRNLRPPIYVFWSAPFLARAESRLPGATRDFHDHYRAVAEFESDGPLPGPLIVYERR